MIGATSTVCAITMACGVNKMPHDPRGPERDSKRNIASPTTTGGTHQRIEDNDRHFAAAKARKGEKGTNGHTHQCRKQTALRLIRSDSLTMANRPGSPVSTN